MARKSAAAILSPPSHPQPVIIDPVRRATYNDYPERLPKFKWLVEEALRSPEKMFNAPTVADSNAHYCKCCGAAYRMQDYAGHVNEHAQQLKLLDRVGLTKNGEIVHTHVEPEKVNEELKLTIIDSLTSQNNDIGLQFTINAGLLGFNIAKEIDKDTVDTGAGDPPLCVNCE